MKYVVELSELVLRELAVLLDKPYNEVTRSSATVEHEVSTYIHLQFHAANKPIPYAHRNCLTSEEVG